MGWWSSESEDSSKSSGIPGMEILLVLVVCFVAGFLYYRYQEQTRREAEMIGWASRLAALGVAVVVVAFIFYAYMTRRSAEAEADASEPATPGAGESDEGEHKGQEGASKKGDGYPKIEEHPSGVTRGEPHLSAHYPQGPYAQPKMGSKATATAKAGKVSVSHDTGRSKDTVTVAHEPKGPNPAIDFSGVLGTVDKGVHLLMLALGILYTVTNIGGAVQQQSTAQVGGGQNTIYVS